MNLTYELIKSEIGKLDKELCQDVKASEDGKKFSLLMLKKLSGYKETKLKKHYTDGSGDHQIDGVYFEEGNELQITILTCKFRSIEKPIEDKDVSDLMNNGLTFLLFGEENVSDLSQKLKDIKMDMDDLRSSYEGKYSVTVKFVNSAHSVLSSNGESAFMAFQAKLQSNNVDIDFQKINDEHISSLFSSRSIQKTPMPIKLSGKSYYRFIEREGFICRLPVQEIMNIYHGFQSNGKSYPGYGQNLFEDNVRKSFGLEKKINRAIYDTAVDEKQARDFEYFNNGLTVVYDDVQGDFLGDSPIVYLQGLQIVNGCQTVNTLIKAKEDNKLLNDIYVTCRFIKRSSDKNFILSVITFTNSQNAISDRDLHSNDPIQYDLQAILRNVGISYERKLNEFRDEEVNARLDALDAAQAYLCCELQKPHRAKQDTRKLFNQLYHEIFDGSKGDLAYKLFLSDRCLDYVRNKQMDAQAKKRESKKQGKLARLSKKDSVVTNGTYHIAALLYKKLFHGLPYENIEKLVRKTIPLPDNIDLLYNEMLASLVRYVQRKNIGKEEIPQLFKAIGIDDIAI